MRKKSRAQELWDILELKYVDKNPAIRLNTILYQNVKAINSDADSIDVGEFSICLLDVIKTFQNLNEDDREFIINNLFVKNPNKNCIQLIGSHARGVIDGGML